jgi:membrane-associated phospholipid phosphatase
MQRLKTFLIWFVLTAVSIAVAYQWFDRPISYFAHDQLASWRIFKEMQRLPEYFAVAACLFFVILGVHVLAQRKVGRCLIALSLSGVSLAVSAQIKDQLKFVFGRTWPETWVNDNPSLIRDGVSNFNFFKGGVGYSSFPSGHMTACCAAISVLWFSYPRYRPFYVLAIADVAIGLIGANYHFLSDLMAGGFIGWCTGWIAVLLWQTDSFRRDDTAHS